MLVVLRPPPDVSLYHRHSNPLFPQTLEHVGRLDDVHAFVIPRTDEQRDYVKSLALPSVIVPDEAVDAQSLIAFSDLVVSAGGTMNREAAALGVPVYTTYGGRLGGVDEQLIRDGRLRPLTDPRALDLHKRDADESEPRAPRPAADARPAAERAARLVAADDGQHLVAVALELRPGRRPAIDARSPSVRGRVRAIASSVLLSKTTYGGTSSSSARARRQTASSW